ncbi:MAG: WYL domain-containing protein [Bacteroidota bacterium]|jgi:hypothetical protein
MQKLNSSRRNRLIALDDFIRNSSGRSFQQIWDFCKLHGKEIKERMVREDIKLLKLGVHNHDIPVNLIIEKGIYNINATGERWSYADLADDERATLPFVFSLLEPYRQLPSVNRVLEDLVESHKLDNKQMKKQAAMFSVKAFPENKAFADLISKVMGLIAKQTACEFNYFKVSDPAGANYNPAIVEVYPLQIRVYNSRYYLIGIRTTAEWEPKNLQIFAMDRIYKYQVDVCYDQDTGEELTFDWNALSKAVGLDKYFEDCIGVYRNFAVDKKPKNVLRWFRGWAASHVEAVPLHKSQEIVKRKGTEILVRWRVYETFELYNILCKYGADCWEI